MTQGTEVGFKRLDVSPFVGDAESKGVLGTSVRNPCIQCDRVAIWADSASWARKWGEPELSRNEQVRAERQRLPIHGEVGEGAVDSRFGKGEGNRPRSVDA